MSLSQEQQALKEELVQSGTPWSSAWESILLQHPAYFAAYLKLARVPLERQALSPKMQSIILLACDVSVTHMYQPGIEAHTANALQRGATPEEVMEVFELVSVLGIHATAVALPLLQEVLEEQGIMSREETQAKWETPDSESYRKAFEKARGYYPAPAWNPLIAFSPKFFAAYTDFSGIPSVNGGYLSKKDKELIYTAIDCATTHMFLPGTKLHLANALKYGASVNEIMEAIELASLMGIHTTLAGAPTLRKLLKEQSSPSTR